MANRSSDEAVREAYPGGIADEELLTESAAERDAVGGFGEWQDRDDDLPDDREDDPGMGGIMIGCR